LGSTFCLSGDREAFSDTLLKAQFSLVNKLYRAGARKFLFINVPPTDRSPFMIAQGDWTVDRLRPIVVTHNKKLAAAAFKWRTTHPDSTIYQYNAWGAFSKILDDYIAYGFTSNSTYGGATDFWG
jgi:phospholipase/lecithinase/hemolysin